MQGGIGIILRNVSNNFPEVLQRFGRKNYLEAHFRTMARALSNGTPCPESSCFSALSNDTCKAASSSADIGASLWDDSHVESASFSRGGNFSIASCISAIVLIP